MINPEAVEAFDPPEPEREKAEYVDGGYGTPAETYRLSMLHHLRRARCCLAALSDAVRSDPGNDTEADEWINLFVLEANRAGIHLEAFRQLRECRGEG